MRVVVAMFAGLVALAAVLAQAVPLRPKPPAIGVGTASSVELVAQGCGWGRHRVRSWDRWGR
jgi:hypothetical protein